MVLSVWAVAADAATPKNAANATQRTTRFMTKISHKHMATGGQHLAPARVPLSPRKAI